MKFIETELPGCYEILPLVSEDPRGSFVKTFHEESFARQGLSAHFSEDFFTVSNRNVLRGLHFHLPPRAHAKLVYCIQGSVLDAAFDLRKGSPAYGRHVTLELSAAKRNMLYLPVGLAHGFYVMSAEAVVVYKVTGSHSPAHDGGIRWDSAGIEWPGSDPILSDRDAKFPPLSEFKTPFVFEGKKARVRA
ncbi:MAG: dTDP-4-dehydrorhamnose 3,5-epimerase [Elusimicrobia bacterium]|nr:dTDP-4-dehydrorhamnose 3,5-epimerase [Elusimicrobiota bacterium]